MNKKAAPDGVSIGRGFLIKASIGFLYTAMILEEPGVFMAKADRRNGIRRLPQFPKLG